MIKMKYRLHHQLYQSRKSYLQQSESVSAAGVYGSTWNYNKTVKYSQKMTWTTVASAASAIGLYTGIKYLTLGGIVGNWIIANKGSWIYYSDKQYWRMAGSTLQTKHVVTWYKDKARTKKIQTQEYITNDRG
ncbi:hypothetical protein ELQ35_11470 [Peribacillus cavernae]|uniref:Uncharacterized protein n=1 Tax=Peribacillus cavernae TaxID=1674310 RepID=A0A3S0U0C6_9BACI|nr:hypothetical protein [Peribacillus cavernae]RUQ28541.1 hypothetical protein ELQ35_11470 [Peribacillus cavernae]